VKRIERYALGFFKAREKLGVREWAEKSVVLSERITEQAGPYSIRLYPYVREVLEAVSDPEVQRVSLCWGSQTSKTTTFYVMLGYTIDQRPRPILWVFPNEQLVRVFSSDRWLPFCRESEVISRHLPRYSEGQVDTDLITLKKQEFDSCTMNLVGAGSSANIRSFPISILVLDEIDVIDEQTRRECLDRVKGRTDYKIFQSSTPVNEHGGIWQEFNEGDKRRFFVTCPNCEAKITFRWKNDEGDLNVTWDEGANLEGGNYELSVVQETARYICENCSGEITDSDKLKMVQAGEWIAGNPNAAKGTRSYHLNSLYSPMITFGRMAVEYLNAKETVDGLRAFTLGWLAEPYKPDQGLVDPAEFKALEVESNERGDILGDYRIISVDVQRTYFVWIVRGFDKEGTSYLIDNGISQVFEDFEAIIDRYEVHKGIIDTGYRTQEIYENIFSNPTFWVGAKGWDKMPTPYRLTRLDPYSVMKKQARKGGGQINLLHVNKQVWQEELLKARSGQKLNWHLYDSVDAEYVRQMLSTNLVERVNAKGKTVTEWLVTGRDDHFWDCETYALAVSSAFGLGGAVIQKVEKKPNRAPTPSQTEESIW
jgi:phage terminase large subunit GpA-like protein|tara:strand:+ start:3064 stop:4848 length:1785 start_codon:yes stop_codon:yes gene_type:complete